MLVRVFMAALGSLLLGCSATPASSSVSTEDAMTLRVVTFNTWMVPFRSNKAHLSVRVAEAVFALDADVVAFQEVWQNRDAEALSRALHDRGYLWSVHRASDVPLPVGSAGLMIASRYPLSQTRFVAFEAGGWPLVLWQPDWMSRKGILIADVATPLGSISFVTTHAQADYPSHDYASVRTPQMVQLGSLVARAELPVIVAGDLNVRRGEVGHAAAVDLAGVSQLADDYGVDTILFRGHDDVSIREVTSRRVLGADSEGRLSDHHGVVATLELRREPWVPVRRAAWRREELDAQASEVWAQAALAAGAAFVVGLSLRRLKMARRWWPRTLLVAILAGLGLWCIYVAVIYSPVRARWLADASRELGADAAPEH